MQTPTKPTVMFADQVSTLGSTCSTAPLSPPAPSRICKAAHDKRGYLNGLLIGLMGIVFGLGIMYLLSRLMHTTRKLAVVERQLKQNQLVVEDIGLQVECMRHQPAPAVPRPVGTPPLKSAVAAPPGSKSISAEKLTQAPPRGVPIPSPAALFDLSLPMANLPMFFEIVMDAPDTQLTVVEEVDEEDDAPLVQSQAQSSPEEADGFSEDAVHAAAGGPGVPSDGETAAAAEQADVTNEDHAEIEKEEPDGEPAKRGRRKGTTAQSKQRKK
jgi:hypothetical protein